MSKSGIISPCNTEGPRPTRKRRWEERATPNPTDPLPWANIKSCSLPSAATTATPSLTVSNRTPSTFFWDTMCPANIPCPSGTWRAITTFTTFTFAPADPCSPCRLMLANSPWPGATTRARTAYRTAPTDPDPGSLAARPLPTTTPRFPPERRRNALARFATGASPRYATCRCGGNTPSSPTSNSGCGCRSAGQTSCSCRPSSSGSGGPQTN
mmetsp:Transcript_33913/g.78305  ORF Transcript_33913/g.78305 Transcript_33913/m.78305 type:complete len:212 (+) Transcript_33913:261-896(+)